MGKLFPNKVFILLNIVVYFAYILEFINLMWIAGRVNASPNERKRVFNQNRNCYMRK